VLQSKGDFGQDLKSLLCYNKRNDLFMRIGKQAMKISILTICPEMFDSFLQSHIVTRALQLQTAEMEVIDIRSYADGSFRHVDDLPYGGGAGMILRCEPVLSALASARIPGSMTIALTPSGEVYSQKQAAQLAQADHVILICGHYEGMDARILSEVDTELSIGDYILTGGELAAMVVADSVLRLLPGNLKSGSLEWESLDQDLLEYPQYTRPDIYQGKSVPPVLRSGDHERIRKWRLRQALLLTRERRPDLFARHVLTPEEKMLLVKADQAAR
jgi:tRNA (guanine37-N1)-methyltransferase